MRPTGPPFGEGDDDRLEVEPLFCQVVFTMARRRRGDGHQSLGDEQLESGRQVVLGSSETLLKVVLLTPAVRPCRALCRLQRPPQAGTDVYSRFSPVKFSKRARCRASEYSSERVS